MKRKRKNKKAFNFKEFFRAFFITAICLTCALGVFAGIFQAQNGIYRDLYNESRAVYSSREVKGGYEITLFGMETTVDLGWTDDAAEIAGYLPVILPPGVRLAAALLFGLEK